MPPDLTVDVLGEPWEAETIGLPPDAEGPVVATLVRHRAPRATGRAVLHLHGFADYFFHTEYAEWWLARGYDVYALDLRKYGRSLRPHQTPTYITDLHDYFAEIDLAWHRIVERDRHDHVVVSAHSTGGLTLPLWADARRPIELAGMVLNSPWFDLQGAAWMRSLAASTVLARVARSQPMREIRRTVTGFYTRSLHHEHDGEWDFDLSWKPVDSFPVRAGWLHAVRQGPARAAPRSLGRLPGARALLGCQRPPRRHGRRGARPRHRARRRPDPAVGDRRRDPRHLRRGARCPARRRALAARSHGSAPTTSSAGGSAPTWHPPRGRCSEQGTR